MVEGTVVASEVSCSLQVRGYKYCRWARRDIITTLTYGTVYKNGCYLYSVCLFTFSNILCSCAVFFGWQIKVLLPALPVYRDLPK